MIGNDSSYVVNSGTDNSGDSCSFYRSPWFRQYDCMYCSLFHVILSVFFHFYSAFFLFDVYRYALLFTKLVRVSVETARHESTYFILLHAGHNEQINDDKTTTFTHRPRVVLTWSSFCYDVTIDCWRHNNETQSHKSLMSNSSDIDFIHSDIHDRSCKNRYYLI